LSVEGRWDAMAKAVPDDVVRIFAACATFDRVADAIQLRFGGIADSIDLHFPPDTPAGLQREILTDIRRIPHSFAGFDTNWQE